MAKKAIPPAWRNRIIGHGEEDAEQLLANPANWRIHPKQQQDALSEVLDRVGWVQDVIINQRTGFVVDGHLRISLAISRGEKVPVVYVDLNPEEEALVLASIDPLSAMAGTDTEKLTELLAHFAVEPGALADMLGALDSSSKPGLTDDDAVPEVQDEPITTLGDCWRLGAHRLVCGDSTDAEAVRFVLGTDVPFLMVTDPPYGVDYDPEWRLEAGLNKPWQTRAEGKVSNDDRSDWVPAWNLFPGDVAYVWHGGADAATVAVSLLAANLIIRAQIIWAKPSLVIGRGAYHWQHEPCWYAVRKGATAHTGGGIVNSQPFGRLRICTVRRDRWTMDTRFTRHKSRLN